MTLTGSPRPTFFYPRFKYGTPAVTLDIPEPVIAFLPQPASTVGLATENRVASGKTETLFGRLEESCGLVLRCEADMLQALRWMCEDSAFRGNQFQAWVDRFTGSCWMFENNLKDQNGLAFTPLTAPDYAAASVGTGVVLSGNYLTVPLAQASAGTPTGYDDPLSKDEGVLVIDFKPAFPTSSGSLHCMLDMSGSINRMSLYKTAASFLILEIVDNSGNSKTLAGSPVWSANDRVTVIASWNNGTLGLWVAINGGAFAALTTLAGSTGILTTLATTLYIGAASSGANPAVGTYDTVAFFKRAFSNPLTLANWRPWRRNYFPYGEVVGRQFAPQRVSFARPIDDWPLIFRNGRP